MFSKRISYNRTSVSVNLDNVVSVAELKNFLRVEHTADDALIRHIRDAAVAYVEEYTNTAIGTATWTAYADRFVPLALPVGPVSAITSISYLATNGGTYETLGTGYYFPDLDGKPARIRFVDAPTLADDELSAVKIVFTGGFADTDVPAAIVHAIYMLTANMYEQRLPEVVGTISSATQFGIAALLAPHRIIYAQ